MSENIILALISKLSANWIVALLIGYFIFREFKKAWNCLYKLFETREAKELNKEQRYYSLLNNYNKALDNNTKALNEFKEAIKEFSNKGV